MKWVDEFEFISKIKSLLDECPPDINGEKAKEDYRAYILSTLRYVEGDCTAKICDLHKEMFTHNAIDEEGFLKGIRYAIEIVEEN